MTLLKFTHEEKKSALITVLITAFLVLILFFIRFTTSTNISLFTDGGGGGGGVTVNFGDSDFGSGDNFKSEILQVTDAKNSKSAQEEVIEEETILTQEKATSNDYVIEKKEIIKKPKDNKVNLDKPKPTTKPEATKSSVSKETNNALASLLGNNKGGDGDDNKAGNKGKANGSLGSSDYYGSGSGTGTGSGNGSGSGSGTGSGSGSGSGTGSGSGSGSGTGYSLGGRRAISKPLPAYKCNETGKVVVEVTVDKSGNTLAATAGIRGTTNNAKCLLEQAKTAAMNTKWESSANAPDKQIGSIIYYFSLN